MSSASFFTSWGDLARIVVVGVLAYLALVVLLRVSGKRTLSKMNAFDFVVTVALGSTLATILLSKSVALAEGVTAFAVLIALQFASTWTSVRSDRVNQLVKSEPALLVFRGQMLPEQMERSRVVESEVMAAVRGQGVPSLQAVEALVLETDGTFSVVSTSSSGERPSFAGVNGFPDDSSDR